MEISSRKKCQYLCPILVLYSLCFKWMENLNPASAMLANVVIDFIMGNRNMSTETIFLSDGAGRVKEALKNVQLKRQ